jgi:hypothetical protein
MYGFLKLMGDTEDKGAYYHEYYLRRREPLSRLICRQHRAKSGVRRKFEAESEPDFGRMPPLANASTMRGFSGAIISQQECNISNRLPSQRKVQYRLFIEHLAQHLPDQLQNREEKEAASPLPTMGHGNTGSSISLCATQLYQNVVQCVAYPTDQVGESISGDSGGEVTSIRTFETMHSMKCIPFGESSAAVPHGSLIMGARLDNHHGRLASSNDTQHTCAVLHPPIDQSTTPRAAFDGNLQFGPIMEGGS